MNPRVLFLDHSGELGGAELYLLDLAHHMGPRSRVVVFADGPFPDRLQVERVPHTVLDLGDGIEGVTRESAIIGMLRAIPAVGRMAVAVAREARTFDVLYANSQKSLIVGGLASVLSRRPLIWNLHDILTADHFSRAIRRLAVLWSNLFVDHVVVNSEATLRAYRTSGGRTLASIVYNGIRADVFDAVSDDQARTLRGELGLGDGPVVGVFSRLAKWKGQHVLLEALCDAPAWSALLVGDALFGADATYAKQLRDFVTAHSLESRVHFAGFRSDIPALMKAVDVVAHTSTAPEPFGRVVVEGMLARRPVLAMRAGGPEEIITHRETGLLVAPNAPNALAEALQWLQSNPESAGQLAERGYDEAKARFSVERMCRRVDDVVAKVAAG